MPIPVWVLLGFAAWTLLPLFTTNMVAGIRFVFFFVQTICMIAMGIFVAISAQG